MQAAAGSQSVQWSTPVDRLPVADDIADAPAPQTLALAIGFAIGMLLNGTMASLYTLVSQSYPVVARTSGVGLVLGVECVGAMLSPTVAGWLLDASWASAQLFLFYAASLLPAIIAVVARHYRQEAAATTPL